MSWSSICCTPDSQVALPGVPVAPPRPLQSSNAASQDSPQDSNAAARTSGNHKLGLLSANPKTATSLPLAATAFRGLACLTDVWVLFWTDGFYHMGMRRLTAAGMSMFLSLERSIALQPAYATE